MRAILRVLAFIGKEIRAIIVQPQLLMLLIAGPFLILLSFGLGYQPHGPLLQTIVVQPPPEDPQQAISFYLSAIGPPLRVVEVSGHLAAALRRLEKREVDLVVVVPSGIRSTLLNGQNARLIFFHNAIDPSRVGYIMAIIDGSTSQLNRAIVKQAIGDEQSDATDYEVVLRELQGHLSETRTALEEDDRPRALQLAQSMRVSSGLIASLWLFGAEPFTDPATPAVHLGERARHLQTLLASRESDPEALEEAIGQMEDDVARMLKGLERSRRIPPDIFVSPLAWEAKGISRYQPGYVAFHSPTVLALLVQHLCVTLAALSLVDERAAGAIELFRVAPLRPDEVLVGKFVAYVVIVAVTVAGLVGLLIYALSVPLLGDWRWFVVVMAALIGASLNLGFLISAMAHSRSQAIQMSMLALLASIFFSGFFVPLPDFVVPVRLLSYSLPVTYGIDLLRQVVLRGEPPQALFLAALVGWAALLGFVAVRLFQRLFVNR